MTQVDRTIRLLIIDDNPGDRALAIRELRREFARIHIREILNAEDFSQALEVGDFDLVITDYQLQWTTGLEIVRALKERYPHRPVIMFTNTGSEEIAVEAMKAGLEDYILKRAGHYTNLLIAVRSALERTEAQRRAALLENRLQRLLTQLSVGVFRFNAVGRLLDGNLSFLNLLGVESLDQAQALQAFNYRQLYAYITGLPSGQKPQWEFQIQQANGNLIWVMLSVMLDMIEEEPIVNALIEDITVRKQAQDQLQRLNETLEARVRERTAQLEAAVRDLEEFSYLVSHDLIAPLRAIGGFSQMLLGGEESLTSQGRSYLRRIDNYTQQAYQLIEDLLEYSRLSFAQMPLEPIDLSMVVAEVLAQLEPEIQQRQARVQVEEPLLSAIANQRILTQVIINLLSNAIKFVAPNVRPQVRLWTEAVSRTSQNSAPKIRLWIEDNGIGIEPNYQERIFNIFIRLHDDDEYPGTGIGLAIVRRGVQRMGGTVGIESQLRQGSRFWIELPQATRNM
jgi:signal transduction histidine kinase